MEFRNWLEKQEDGIPIKKVIQSHDFDCGAAALKAIAGYFKIQADEKDFIRICDAGKVKGTHPWDIVQAAKKLGFQAKKYTNMSLEQLKLFLDEKKPVICAIQAWGNKKDYHKLKDGHYVVAIAYDKKYIYFEDPSMRKHRGFLSHKEFMDRWDDQEHRGPRQIRMGIVVFKNKSGKKHVVGSAKRIP